MTPFVRSLIAVLLSLCLCAQALGSSDAAQTDKIDQARSDRDQVRSERTRAAADLDPLLAANDEIEDAIALLNDQLQARQASLDATQAKLNKARVDVATAHQHIAEEQGRISDLQVQLQEQAISAYVEPRSDGISQEVLAASDINDGERRRALMLAVTSSQADVLDGLRIARANMEVAATRAEAAEAVIAQRELLAIRQLEEFNTAIADQHRLQSMLEARIAEFQAEVDEHRMDEEALTSKILNLVAEEEARRAAIERAARIRAARERLAQEQARLAAQRASDIAAGRVSGAAVVNQADAQLLDAPGALVGSMRWPVQGPVTSGFGPRWGRMHNGIDIAANSGTNVLAAADGVVVEAGRNGGFGNLVLVDHGGGLITGYAHLSAINVSVGQLVVAGNSLGRVGCTGHCTGPHLHFETRVASVPYDPLLYIA